MSLDSRKTVRQIFVVSVALGFAYFLDLVITDAQGFPPFMLSAGLTAAWLVRGRTGSGAGVLFGSTIIIVIGLLLRDPGEVIVALAALVGSGLLAAAIRRWRPNGRIRSPFDPLQIGLGVGLIMLIPAVIAEIGNFGDLGIVWGAAVVGTLVVLLPTMCYANSIDQGRWLEFGFVGAAVLVLVLGYVMFSTQDLVLGLAAWGLSPVVILLSTRYGAGRGSLLVSLIVLVVPIARIVSDDFVPIQEVLARQGVAIFLLLTTNAAVILLRQDRLISTKLTRQSQEMSEQAQLLTATFDSAPLATLVVEMGAAPRVESANRAASVLFDLPVNELNSMAMVDLMQPEEWRQLEVPSREVLEPDSPSDLRIQKELPLSQDGLEDKTVVATVGRLDLGDASDKSRVILHLEDVTTQRSLRDKMRQASETDKTTGLYNRKGLVDKLDASLHRMGVEYDGKKASSGLALVVCDLDEFQKLNDSYGYAAGDGVLIETRTRIAETVPEGSVLARLGADEFAIVVPETTQDNVAVLIHRLQRALSRNFADIDREAAVLASFGAVIVTEKGLSAEEVMRRAELALYHAKSGGLGRVNFYADAMRKRAQKILNVREELASAIANDTFSVAYQPIVNLDDGGVVAYEALVRLVARDGRLLLPGDFLAIARSADLVNVIDDSVLRRALADVRSDRLAQSSAGLNVNCEPQDLRNPDYSMNVLSRLHAAEMDPSRLTVEVTESALLEVDAAVQGNVAALREAGIRIAIDDFGSGYSSLSQLRKLNPDLLKIDRSFIADLNAQNLQSSIVASVIDLAHQLDIKVTAEGIETREQAEALRKMGCDLGQGFLFGRPEHPLGKQSRAQAGKTRDGKYQLPPGSHLS